MDNNIHYSNAGQESGGTSVNEVRQLMGGQDGNWQGGNQFQVDGQERDSNIDRLVRDLDNELPEETEEGEGHLGTLSGALFGGASSDAIDAALLFAIYFILSQESVRNFIGGYIPQVDPKLGVKVGLFGIAIYGAILVVAYKLIKKYLLDTQQR